MQFGLWLQDARRDAGIGSQSELATLLGTRQQTISKWENGSVVPRATVAPKLAAALRVDLGLVVDVLGRQAAMASHQDAPSFASAWPLDLLSPLDFERLCAQIGEVLFAPAEVSLQGTTGDAQGGIDVRIARENGERIVIQCKRVSQFGPKALERAVAAAEHFSADKKILCLSSVAGAAVRNALDRFQGWALWDREDLTRKIKQFDLDTQHRLVGRFFPGRRFELTGEQEPSPWFTAEQFFASNEPGGAGLPQNWSLVGRENLLAEINEFLAGPTPSFLFLTGNAGSGKTRILREAALTAKTRTVRLLSKDLLTNRAFEVLPTGPKLLICDDAHERDDLGLLFQYGANASHESHVIIGLRAYGQQRVEEQSRMVRLEKTQNVQLPALSKSAALTLAKEALDYYGANPQFADVLAGYTRDCPLGTVIGAQVLSKEGANPYFLKSDDSFNRELMRQFVRKTVEEVSVGLDRKTVEKVLAACALIQPFTPDKTLVAALAAEFRVDSTDVQEVLRKLYDASVLYKRGASTRVSPDLFADFLIEHYFVEDGRSNGRAEAIFKIAGDGFAENILVNLGRLDWRKSKGQTTGSVVLSELWGSLEWGSKYANPHARAASAVAFYQPSQALDYAERMIEKGHSEEVLGSLIKNAAYNPAYLERCCALLWRLGADDTSGFGRKPGHGVRLLAELAGPEPLKPSYYSEKVVEFGLRLLRDRADPDRANSPWDFLESVLATDRTTTQSRNYSIVMTQFMVNPEAMRSLRGEVIDAAIASLTLPDTSRAIRAARVFNSALRFPIRGGEHRGAWEDEFVETLNKLVAVIRSRTVPPTVLTALAHTVSWHANYANGRTMGPAREIIDQLNEDLRTLTISKLIDGHGQLTMHVDELTSDATLPSATYEVAKLLREQFPEAPNLLAFLDSCLDEIAAAYKGLAGTSPQALFNELFQHSGPLCKLLMAKAEVEPKSHLAWFAGGALARLLEHDREAASTIVRNILKEADGPKLYWVAEAYWVFRPMDGTYSEVDRSALEAIVQSTRVGVHWPGSGMLRQVSLTDDELAFALLLKANLGLSAEVADRYLTWVSQKQFFSVERLGASGIKLILSKLENFDDLSSFWIQEFFKNVLAILPEPLIKFFLKRINKAARGRAYPFQPAPTGPQRTAKLTISVDAERWIIYILNWTLAKTQEELRVLSDIGELTELLFGPFDPSFVSLLEGWAHPADKAHLEVVLGVLRQAHSNFVFQYHDFVVRLMRWAESLGDKALKKALSTMDTTTWRGMRSGRPGEPFPQDIDLRERAISMLSQTNRFEPAYRLYEMVLEHANEAIGRQQQMKESMVADQDDEHEE